MKTSFLFLTTGFEEIEALATVDILRRAGVSLITVSVEETLEVAGANGVTVKADSMLKDNDYNNAEILILPGGTIRLGEFEYLNELLKKQHNASKPIAAICAAPSVLGNIGILKGQNATCYPGFEQYLAEANFVDAPFVCSNNIITGKGPGYTFDFALAIVERLKGKDKADEVAKGMLIR